jgi:uncharacterized low-complexity protein
MKKFAIKAVIVGAFALGATAAYAAVGPQQSQTEQTPKGWSYNIQNGQRVAKGNRVTNADGSWREEVKQGKCTTVKEKSASGEYKETRQCDPS